ncbi:hypothetical protein DDZ18_08185 [Marinicauda salina]|uniref:Glycosyltransferase n=2 Tax=Marinicauda salina TaxID=2135793 RepID=A0A2U2BUH1_9PROT|nr:hypothetical protein DDZ18_08185 [Marinicauda salina]
MFAKAPVIGGAKTRLAAGVGRVEAWRLHRAMTARLLRRLRDPRWETVLAVAPDAAVSRRYPGVWPEALKRVAQGGGDLGARQRRIFSWRPPTPTLPSGGREKRGRLSDSLPSRGGTGWGGRRGCRRPTVVIGSDAPGVTRADIAAAFAALRRHDAVIGPAEDGGYWLLGLKAPAPAGLFDGVRWSHSGTRGDVERNLARFGMSWTHLRTLADIDEADDLKRNR